MAARVKKDDLVVVLSGDDKGKTGKVLRVIPDKNQVLVEGLNLVWKHLKPTQANPKGSRIRKPVAMDLSKVQVVDPTTGKGTRVKFVVANGEKRRVAVKSGTDLGLVSKV